MQMYATTKYTALQLRTIAQLHFWYVVAVTTGAASISSDSGTVSNCPYSRTLVK
jgi:hypothetical protein